MTKQLDFIFDFASPNAYLAYKVLPTILLSLNYLARTFTKL